MEPVGNPQLGDAPDHMDQHIAAARHDETDVRQPFEHFGRRLDEIVGAFLVGDPPEERHDLILHVPFALPGIPLVETHRIVHGHDFVRRNPVFLDHDVARQVAHGNHAVGGFHAGPFDVIDRLVDMLAATIELGRVHVYHQRLAGHPFGGDPRIVGQPVVRMDHIELPGPIPGDLRGDHRIARHFLHQVRPVFSGKSIALFPYVVSPGQLPGFAELPRIIVELLGRHIGHHIGIHMDKRQLLPNFFLPRIVRGHFHVARVDDPYETAVLVPVSLRHHEDHSDVVLGQSPGQSVACSSQSSRDMRRKFPSEHQYSHLLYGFYYFISIQFVFLFSTPTHKQRSFF